MVFSIREIIDVIVMTVFVGFIFKDFFKRFKPVIQKHLSVEHLLKRTSGFDWDSFKFAAMVTAPAIIIHELGHKMVALSYGLHAEFHAAYFWLALGLVLKLLNFSFIFFVPAYVSISGAATPLQYSFIAFAGPLMNLLIWGAITILIKNNMVPKKYLSLAFLTKKINMFLFIFNMIPLPMFDGYKVFHGLIQSFIF